MVNTHSELLMNGPICIVIRVPTHTDPSDQAAEKCDLAFLFVIAAFYLHRRCFISVNFHLRSYLV